MDEDEWARRRIRELEEGEAIHAIEMGSPGDRADLAAAQRVVDSLS